MPSNGLLHNNVSVMLLGVLLSDMLQQAASIVNSFLMINTFYNVHTWAISFLRNLANMSSMVPFSIFVPNWGPRPKPRRPEEVVYIPNDSCSHFTQRLFPPKLPQQHTCTAYYDTFTSFILIIHHIHTSNYSLYSHDIFTLTLSMTTVAGRLPSVLCVRYSNFAVHTYDL